MDNTFPRVEPTEQDCIKTLGLWFRIQRVRHECMAYPGLVVIKSQSTNTKDARTSVNQNMSCYDV